MNKNETQSEQPNIEQKSAGNSYAESTGWPFGEFNSRKFDYVGEPPFADAEWANHPDAMCLWCAGTGHPKGNPEYGMCKCPDMANN